MSLLPPESFHHSNRLAALLTSKSIYQTEGELAAADKIAKWDQVYFVGIIVIGSLAQVPESGTPQKHLTRDIRAIRAERELLSHCDSIEGVPK